MLKILQKKDSFLDAFFEICEVLQNLNFTEDSWATAFDFQQHFGHMCSISNKSTADCLSGTSTKNCLQASHSVCRENI